MSSFPLFSANVAIAYTAYSIGAASPGPSNLAIMATAMVRGRAQAIALAAGVISGSLLWGVLAAFGLASLMRSYSTALVVMKIVGGVYLLWLSWKAARAAYSGTPQGAEPGAPRKQSYSRTYAKGAAMHVTNPKAILVWLSIVSLALPQDASTSDALAVVAGCGALGTLIFGGYALAFSIPAVRRTYQAIHRPFNAALFGVFAYAGIRMLLSNQSR
jgi:threonine/homoserine/homoserine lactone efflux protein